MACRGAVVRGAVPALGPARRWGRCPRTASSAAGHPRKECCSPGRAKNMQCIGQSGFMMQVVDRIIKVGKYSGKRGYCYHDKNPGGRLTRTAMCSIRRLRHADCVAMGEPHNEAVVVRVCEPPRTAPSNLYVQSGTFRRPRLGQRIKRCEQPDLRHVSGSLTQAHK